MHNVRSLNRPTARVTATTATLLLAACGGSGGDSSAVTNSAAMPSGASDTSASTPSTNANFFDSVFLDGSGAGYYQFRSNIPRNSSRPVATGRTRIFVAGEGDQNFSRTTDVIPGSYSPNLDSGYITAEGCVVTARPLT